jgi:hypothetical protein
MKKSLQKEFNSLPRDTDGLVSFLINNFENNRSFVVAKLKKLIELTGIEKYENLIIEKEKAVETARKVYTHYVEFRKLSERQKTLIRGFKWFVAVREGELFVNELRNLTRYWQNDGDSNNDGWVSRTRTYRANYKNILLKEEAELNKLEQNLSLLLEANRLIESVK